MSSMKEEGGEGRRLNSIYEFGFGNVKTTSQKADVAFASKSNNIDTSKNKLPTYW